MNYKLLITFAALALIFASCAKDEAIIEQTNLTPVQLTLSLSQTGEPVTRAAFHEKDASNPRLLRATWQQGEQITLVIWQDGADWKTDPNLIEKSVFLPAEAEGQTSIDLSSLIGSIDLSKFDNTKNIKYAVVKCQFWLSKQGTLFSPSGFSQTWDATLASNPGQLDNVMLATPVQETAVPTGSAPLVLQGKLEWRCAVLAIKWNIAPEAADIVYGNSNYFQLKRPNASSTQNYPVYDYDPILRKAGDISGVFNMVFSLMDKKLGDMAVTPQGYRYFAIPAKDDNYVDATGSRLIINTYKPDGSSMLVDHFITDLNGSVPIEAGFCYSLNLKVTDTDGDGIPEFARE